VSEKLNPSRAFTQTEQARNIVNLCNISNHHTRGNYRNQRKVTLVTQLAMVKLVTERYVKGKVKCTLVQALRLYTGRTGHRGIRGIALPFHYHGTRRELGVSVTPRPIFTPGKDPVTLV